MKKKKSNLELSKQIRNDWGMVKPYTVKFKSKKDYNRKDKSWLKDYDEYDE